MKTSTLKSVVIIIAICLFTLPIMAQNYVGIRIDVYGSRYSDQMWLFSVPTCTRNFDNGWDGFKMLGTNSYSPTIYASEVNGNFQVDAVPDFNNTFIAFKGGEDSQYTLSFYSEYLATMYQHLYLVDLVANKTVDILNSGVIYTFAVNKATDPLIRFQLITSLPTSPEPPVVPVTPVDTTTVTPVDTTTVTPIVPVVPVETPVDTVVVVPPTDPVVIVPEQPADSTVITDPEDNTDTTPVVDNNKGKKDKDNKDCKKDKKEKKLKITCSKRTITIENKGKSKGALKIYNAITGKMVHTTQINSNGKTIVESNAPKGTYVINGTTTEDDETVTVIIQ